MNVPTAERGRRAWRFGAAFLVLVVLGSSPTVTSDPPSHGPDAFIHAFQAHLGDKATTCSQSRNLAYADFAYQVDRYAAWSRESRARDMRCFGYGQEAKVFKKDLRDFLEQHGEEHGAKTVGRWHYDEYVSDGEANVGGRDYHRMQTYGKRHGMYRIELDVDKISCQLVLDEESATVSLWYDRR